MNSIITMIQGSLLIKLFFTIKWLFRFKVLQCSRFWRWPGFNAIKLPVHVIRIKNQQEVKDICWSYIKLMILQGNCFCIVEAIFVKIRTQVLIIRGLFICDFAYSWSKFCFIQRKYPSILALCCYCPKMVVISIGCFDSICN